LRAFKHRHLRIFSFDEIGLCLGHFFLLRFLPVSSSGLFRTDWHPSPPRGGRRSCCWCSSSSDEHFFFVCSVRARSQVRDDDVCRGEKWICAERNKHRRRFLYLGFQKNQQRFSPLSLLFFPPRTSSNFIFFCVVHTYQSTRLFPSLFFARTHTRARIFQKGTTAPHRTARERERVSTRHTTQRVSSSYSFKVWEKKFFVHLSVFVKRRVRYKKKRNHVSI